MRALIDDDAVPPMGNFDSFKEVVAPDHLGCGWAELSLAVFFRASALMRPR